MTKLYEVYECRVNGELVYIGSGVEGRYKHCDSGLSHNYDLNKAHFDKNCVVTTKVVKKFNNKEDSLTLEKELILRENPKYNRVFVNDHRQDYAKQMKDFKKFVKDKVYLTKTLSHIGRKKCLDVLDEFCEAHGYSALCEKGFYLNSHHWYEKRDFKSMKKCVNTARKLSDNYATTILSILEEACAVYFPHDV